MLFSKDWLSQYIDGEMPKTEDIAEQIGLHSFEVEGFEEKDGDAIIDIDVLPNRAHDALSYLGMAGEVALIFNLPFKMVDTEVETTDFQSKDMLALSVEDSTLVPRATKRVIRNVKVGPSPEWLVERLETMGQRSINNIVDITNFVMYEFGQPVHAFDYEKIAGDGVKNISIRTAKDGEEIETLDGNTFSLIKDMVVIADDEKALDIAGIKGGSVSGIDENTHTIVLSVCNFDAENIRKTSKTLGLRTDASSRFEKGISPMLAIEASNRASKLIRDFAGGEVLSDVLDEYPNTQEKVVVRVRHERVNKLLGTNISIDEIKNIFERLDFSYEEKESGVFDVSGPLYRLDINIEEDVIEEIARVYGYQNIEEEKAYEGHGPVEIHKEFYWINKIKDILVREGFSEVSTYSFVDEGEIELQKPMAQDKGFLRPTLSIGFEKALEHARHNAPLLGTDNVRIFEIGTVFSKDDERVELIASEDVSEILKEALGIDLVVENMIVNLSELFEKLPDPENYDDLEELSFDGKEYKEISQYPFVLRDIAVWVPESVAQEELENIIRENASNLLVNMYPFDEFKKDGRVSYGLRMVFQSMDKTLTDSEVNEVMDKVTNTLNSQDGFEVR